MGRHSRAKTLGRIEKRAVEAAAGIQPIMAENRVLQSQVRELSQKILILESELDAKEAQFDRTFGELIKEKNEHSANRLRFVKEFTLAQVQIERLSGVLELAVRVDGLRAVANEADRQLQEAMSELGEALAEEA